MTSQPILTELLGQKKYFRCESLWSVDQHELFGSRDTVPALADACVSGACNFTYGVACVLAGSCMSFFEPCLLKWRTNSTSSSRQGNDCAFCSSRKIKDYLCSPPCHWAVLLFLLTSFVWLLNDMPNRSTLGQCGDVSIDCKISRTDEGIIISQAHTH